MFCPSCGVETQDGAAFCRRCGANLQNTRTTVAPLTRGATQYASSWKRFGAFIIDWILSNIAGFIVGFIYGFLTGMGGARADADAMTAILLIAYVSYIVVVWLYFAGMESSSSQATFGKQAMSIYVTDLNGHRISFGKATGRYFGKLVTGLTMGIGYLMIAFTEKKQGLHDKMAGCLVVTRERVDDRQGQHRVLFSQGQGV